MSAPACAVCTMGRSGNKRHRMMHPMMNPMMGMMGMNPMMMNPMMAGMMNQQEESSSDEQPAEAKAAAPVAPAAPVSQCEDHGRQQRGGLAQVISKSVTTIRHVPRVHLSEMCETLDPMFEASLTSELSVVGLLALVYLFTRLRPCTQISVLQISAFQ